MENQITEKIATVNQKVAAMNEKIVATDQKIAAIEQKIGKPSAATSLRHNIKDKLVKSLAEYNELEKFEKSKTQSHMAHSFLILITTKHAA